MRIGHMAESGSNRRPDFYDNLHKRKKRDKHSAEELAEDTGAKNKSVIFRGLEGVLVPEEVKEGRNKKHYFLEADLQWLEDEIAAGRVYPIRAAKPQPVQVLKDQRELFIELAESCHDAKKLEALEDVQDNFAFRKQFRKVKGTRDAIVYLLSDFAEIGDQGGRSLAEAGLLASRLSESIGLSQKRLDALQEKKR